MLRHIRIKLSKDKKRTLKPASERRFITYEGSWEGSYQPAGRQRDKSALLPWASKAPLSQVRQLRPQRVRGDDPVLPENQCCPLPLQTTTLSSFLEIPSAWAMGARQ